MKTIATFAVMAVVCSLVGCAAGQDPSHDDSTNALVSNPLPPKEPAFAETPPPVAAVSGGNAPVVAPPADPGTTYALVQLESVYVNAHPVQQACWDWDCDASKAATVFAACEKAAAAVSTVDAFDGALAEVAVQLGSLIAEGTAAPDATGYVQIITGGQPGYWWSLPPVNNQYMPQWSGASFDHVPLTEGTALAVNLSDNDNLTTNETMANVAIGVEDLRKALAAGKTYSVDVSKETGGAVLFINILVLPQP